MSPFLAWGDFHARSRSARSTIPEEKWGTTRSLVPLVPSRTSMQTQASRDLESRLRLTPFWNMLLSFLFIYRSMFIFTHKNKDIHATSIRKDHFFQFLSVDFLTWVIVILKPDVSTLPSIQFFDSESTGVIVAVTLLRPNLWIVVVVERKIERFRVAFTANGKY